MNAPEHLKGEVQDQNLSFLDQLNRNHLQQHIGERDLEARIASYELAARMQDAAREALDISQETKETHQLYGLDQNETREYGNTLFDCPAIGGARGAIRAVVSQRSALGQSQQLGNVVAIYQQEDRQAISCIGTRPQTSWDAGRSLGALGW